MEPDIESDGKFGAGTDDLIVELYGELRRIARREHFRGGQPQTLQTTALVGEAYVRLKRRDGWEGRAHFLGCAATAMRHVLIDDARARLRLKRTGSQVPLEEDLPGEIEDAQLIKLGEALAVLAKVDSELATIVECRFFAGCDEQETAQILGVTDRTVRRKWVRARAWIHAEMAEP